MPRRQILIKISGDLADNRNDVLSFIEQKDAEGFVVVCIGGGTRISEACERENIPFKFGPLGRELATFEGRQLARNVLELNQRDVQDRLACRGIHSTVVIPVLDIASALCHVNGDAYVQAAYLGFDEIYVLTLDERIKKKREQFKDLPKVTVIGFPSTFGRGGKITARLQGKIS